MAFSHIIVDLWLLANYNIVMAESHNNILEVRKMNKINVNLIREYLRMNKLTIKEFCEQCKISRSTFYRITKGEDFNLLFLLKIAKKINKNLCDFFS